MSGSKASIEKLLKRKIFWIAILGAITFFFWLPTKNLPYWWDSAGYIVYGARFYIKTNFKTIFLSSEPIITAFAHPPFFVFTLALLWKIFGESLLLSHLYYLVFVMLAVVFTFLLGSKVASFKDELMSNLVGFSSALLLLFSPVFLAQLGIVYPEIPICAFGVMTVYFFLMNKKGWYLLSSLLMVLTKETSAIIVIAILGLVFINFILRVFQKRERKIFPELKKTIKEGAFYSLPGLVLAGWFVWHKLATGWMFVMPYYQEHLTKGALSLGKIAYPLNFILFSQFRFLVTFAVVAALLYFLGSREKREILQRKEVLICLLVIVFSIFLFGVVDFLHRYSNFGLPYLLIIFSFFLGYLLLKRKGFYLFLLAVLLFLFRSQWDNHREFRSWRFAPLEENLEYRDIIDIGKEMASFIERNYPEATVLTSFPTNYMLAEPFQHYVSKPIKVIECRELKEEEIDLVVFHFFSPGEIRCSEVVMQRDMGLLVTFEKNGKFIQIYK